MWPIKAANSCSESAVRKTGGGGGKNLWRFVADSSASFCAPKWFLKHTVQGMKTFNIENTAWLTLEEERWVRGENENTEKNGG